MPGGTPATKLKVNIYYKIVEFKLLCDCFLIVLLSCQQDQVPRIKVVTALYPFKAIEPGDLTLVKVSKPKKH